MRNGCGGGERNIPKPDISSAAYFGRFKPLAKVRNAPKANTSQLSSPLHQKDTHHVQSPQNNVPAKLNPRFTRPEATKNARHLNHLKFSSRDASSLWVSCRIFKLSFHNGRPSVRWLSAILFVMYRKFGEAYPFFDTHMF